MSTPMHDILYKNKTIDNVVYELRTMARAHFRLGQDSLGQELENLAEGLDHYQKALRDTHATENHKAFQESVNQVGKTLNAMANACTPKDEQAKTE